MIDQTTRERIKGLIIQKIKDSEEDVLILTEMTKPISPENAIGRISRMDAINNKSVNESGLRQAKEKLIRLNIALQSID